MSAVSTAGRRSALPGQLDLFSTDQPGPAPTLQAPSPRPLDRPMCISVNDAMKRYGIGRTKLYELLGDGSLKAWKLGAKTLIDLNGADAFFASLPAFTSD